MTTGETALLPNDEGKHIAAVHRYDILDTPPDGVFDRITALAARLFDVPIAIIGIVDADRIWLKSHHGLPGAPLHCRCSMSAGCRSACLY